MPNAIPVKRSLTVAALTLIVLVGCQARPSSQSGPAPDFALKDLSGKTVTLASLRGKPVMLDFWATWCGPCQMSIPLVQQFYTRHKAEGLTVLGINIDEDPRGVYAFTQKFEMTYPVVLAGDTNVPDSYRVQGIPAFVFIDAEGNITRRFDGFHLSMINAWEEEYQRLKAASPR